MKELEIFNLYEKSSEKNEKRFFNKIDSSLRVKIDYEKILTDTSWIDLMEITIPYLDNIFRSPNRFIINEEELVKIELARKITVESIKHLSKNTNLIQDYNKQTGDVRPSKILNINKEETYDTYENRLIYTLIQNMKYYISVMKKTIVELTGVKQKDEKQLEYKATSNILGEKVEINTQLKAQVTTNGEGSNQNILERIENLENKIIDLSSSEVYKVIEKKHITLVRPPIKKTNVVLKNVNFQYAMKLWDFLQEEVSDRTTHIKENKDYMANDELKDMMDETFYLEYLAINSLEKDKVENEESQRSVTEQMLTHMIQKIMTLDVTITNNDLQKMIANSYQEIKFRNIATINEIQKSFKTHIDKYLNKIKQ